MKNLDETKVYYLGDLSDEQKEELLVHLRCTDSKLAWYYLLPKSRYLIYDNEWHEGSDLDELREDLNNEHPLVNALTLFEKDPSQRIIEIQLIMKELNNEILDLDDELRELTYNNKLEKK